MQLELIIIFLFAGLILLALGIIIGVLLNNSYGELPFPTPIARGTVKNSKKDEEDAYVAEDTDTAQPGIIYRPTAEEINKMNEPQQMREAKEELAKTFASIKEPEA